MASSEAASPSARAVAAGAAVYKPWVLHGYDAFVHGFSNAFAWRCPTRMLRSLYDAHAADTHLDVGVGSGYFLDRCQFPGDRPRIVLVDLNPNALKFTARRIRRLHPVIHRANVLEPLTLEGGPYHVAALPNPWQGRWMCRNVNHTVWLLMLLSCCGDSGVVEGVTDQCSLEPIVEARLARGAVDCSPERDPNEEPVPLLTLIERADDGGDDAAIQCIRDALTSRRDAVYLSELIAGTDSLIQSAKFVSANGDTTVLSYDSSPSGQDLGGNTVTLRECAPFSMAPHLGCQDESSQRLVCTHDESVRRSFR